MPYEYEDALQRAPDAVKRRIYEFRDLSERQKERSPLLYYVLGTGTPSYKMEKEDAEYVEKSETEGQTCGNCEFAYKKVVRDSFICSQMRGGIKPEAWCKLWKVPREEA